MKEKLFSAIRIGVAALAGMLLSWLAAAGFVSEETNQAIETIVNDVSFVVGTVVWYFLARLVENHFPWLLGLSTPKSIAQTPPPRSRF